MSETTQVAINGAIKAKDAASASITVKHETGFNQLHVGHTAGEGENYGPVDEAQVTVWFEENKVKQIWSGDFAALKALLFTEGYPNSIAGSWDARYTLQCITKDNVYYGNEEEGDENANTMCFSRDMKLLSDNIHASNALFEVAENDKDIVWASPTFRWWQKEQFQTEGDSSEG